MMLSSGRRFDDTHDVAFLHDDEILVVDLDLGARPLAEQHAVPDLYVEVVQFAVFAAGPRPVGEDLALHRLFPCGVGDDDAASALFFLLDATHEYAILQRSKCHGDTSISYRTLA